MHQRTDLAAGPINNSDRLTVELIRPVDAPPIVAINWPTAATIATPANYPAVAEAITRIVAESAGALARWAAGRLGLLTAPDKSRGDFSPRLCHFPTSSNPSVSNEASIVLDQ